MARKASQTPHFNIIVVGQAGRLQYEAAIFAASLRHTNRDFKGRLFVAEPQPGPMWTSDPRMQNSGVRELLNEFDAEILPFENQFFGQSYPYGNKIEALKALPKGEPFVFFDTDTLITGDLGQVPFDFTRPSASRKVQGTWPTIELYGPGYTETWKSLYDMFDLDFDSSLDHAWPDEFWRHYLYFNAGFFYYDCPRVFGRLFTECARAIRDTPPPELICQTMDPWLDQVALPLVIHALGGGRDTLPEDLLDGSVSCHYRLLPLLYARESDLVVDIMEQITAPNKVKKEQLEYNPIKHMVYHGRGLKVRDMFDRDNLPPKEQTIRNQIRKAGFWMR